MLKISVKAALTVAALTLGVTTANAAPKVDTATLDLTGSGRIIVLAEDGQNYSRLVSQNLKFKGGIDVSMESGKIARYGVYLGLCGKGQCGTLAFKTLHLRNFGATSEVNEDISFDVSGDQFPQGLSNNVQASKIFSKCNDKARNSAGEHTFTQNVQVTLGLDYKGFGFDSGALPKDYTAHYVVPVHIICRALPVEDTPAPQPLSVDLEVEQQGNTCPKKTEVRALIRYRQQTTAKFRFRRDGKLSELITIKARKVGGKKNATYLVERVKTYYLDPGKHHFRVEVRGGKKSYVKTLTIDCPPFKVTSAWLKYDVQNTPTCPKNVKEVATFKATRPGTAPFEIKTQGGLVVHSGTATFKRKGMEYVAKVKRKNLQMGAFDSDMMALIKTQPSANSGWVRLKVECLKLAGDFSFIDNTGTQCTREGKALLNFSMNMKANIHYSLDCTNGHFSGVAQAVPDNKGSFVAPALVKFDIDKTTQVNCALKSVSPGKTKIHKLKGHLFRCVKRNIDPQSDLSPETRPDPSQDTSLPRLVVDPVPEIRCVNGRKTGNQCQCLRGYKLINTGARSYRCDKQLVIDPSRPPSVPGGPSSVQGATISCAGGAVRNGKCFCPKDFKMTTAGTNAYRCVKVTVEPVKPDSSAADARSEAAKKAAEAKRKREAAKKAAEAKRKREAAKKAAQARRKREAAKKTAQARRKREAAKKAAATARKKRTGAQRRGGKRRGGKRRRS